MIRRIPGSAAAFTPCFSVNPQTGYQELDRVRNQIGTIELLHSPRWPSRLLLPKIPLCQTE